jgi:hypothetical protein
MHFGYANEYCPQVHAQSNGICGLCKTHASAMPQPRFAWTPESLVGHGGVWEDHRFPTIVSAHYSHTPTLYVVVHLGVINIPWIVNPIIWMA